MASPCGDFQSQPRRKTHAFWTTYQYRLVLENKVFFSLFFNLNALLVLAACIWMLSDLQNPHGQCRLNTVTLLTYGCASCSSQPFPISSLPFLGCRAIISVSCNSRPCSQHGLGHHMPLHTTGKSTYCKVKLLKTTLLPLTSTCSLLFSSPTLILLLTFSTW